MSWSAWICSAWLYNIKQEPSDLLQAPPPCYGWFQRSGSFSRRCVEPQLFFYAGLGKQERLHVVPVWSSYTINTRIFKICRVIRVIPLTVFIYFIIFCLSVLKIRLFQVTEEQLLCWFVLHCLDFGSEELDLNSSSSFYDWTSGCLRTFTDGWIVVRSFSSFSLRLQRTDEAPGGVSTWQTCQKRGGGVLQIII